MTIYNNIWPNKNLLLEDNNMKKKNKKYKTILLKEY